MLGTSLRSLFRTSVHLQNIHILHIIMKIYIFHSFMFVRLCYQVSQPIIKRGQFFKRKWTLTIFVNSYTQVFLLSVWISRMYEQVLCSLNRNSTHIYLLWNVIIFHKNKFLCSPFSPIPDQIVQRKLVIEFWISR